MRLFNASLLAGIAVLALPADLVRRSPAIPGNTLTLNRPLNTTSTLRDYESPICFDCTITSAYVSILTCRPLLTWIATLPNAAVPHHWVPGPHQPAWTLQGCQVGIVGGHWDAVFSLEDVVSQAVRILTVCQPPPWSGCGGLAPVKGTAGLMYASFHVQVSGVEN